MNRSKFPFYFLIQSKSSLPFFSVLIFQSITVRNSYLSAGIIYVLLQKDLLANNIQTVEYFDWECYGERKNSLF